MHRCILVIVMSIFFSLFFYAVSTQSCTNILITKGASSDGSVIVAHTNDNELGDNRIVYMPARDYGTGAKRAVYPYIRNYPRYVGKDFSPAYDTPGLPVTKPLGYIKQATHTYASFDASYPLINEHQLMIAEGTNGAKIKPQAQPNKLIFFSSELARVAMERCKKAKAAVILMGGLIDKYGYYGTGETLLVADTEEGWVFEMCGSPDGKGGLWVAKRVPDGEIFVCANEFRIREVEPKDPDMLYSKKLLEVALKFGWWNPNDGKLDWLKTVSYGEEYHPYYSLRRVWRILDILAPSLKFNPWVENGYTKQYPFSIKPDKKVSVKDIMKIFRDHYEGTEFDLTVGTAAGPFGNPNRWVGPYDSTKDDLSFIDQKGIAGAWERPISVFYCGYSHICQARSWLPNPIGAIAWIGLDVPHNTCYIPFYIGIKDLPQSFQQGNTQEFNRNAAWWAFNVTGNLLNIKYGYMIEDILSLQTEMENKELQAQSAVETKAVELYKESPQEAQAYLTDYCITNAQKIVDTWWQLSESLLVGYNAGYYNLPFLAQKIGYPDWWLKQVGYDQGPTSYRRNQETQH